MEFVELLKQVFIVAFGVLVALVLTFFIIWPKVESFLVKLSHHKKNKELLKNSQQLKFTAYERLILFTLRISPYQVMLRHHNTTLPVNQFKQLVVQDIENEFQHNFTQQLYISDAAWTVIKELKENTISLFNNSSNILKHDASIDDYVSLILKHVNELEVNPYEAAQTILKKELSA